MFHPRFSHPSAHVTAAVASIAALGMLLAGCGTSGGTGSPSAQGSSSTATTSVITVNNVEPSANLLPGNTNDMASWKVVTQLFEGLVTFSDDGELIYAEAESITPNSDASQYTITLRDGLRFSDGQKITAQTYAKAWSFAANAANGQLGAAIFSTIQGYDALQDTNGGNDAQLSGLKVVDDHTLQVTLNAPDSSFPYKVGDVAFLPIPESAYADANAFGEHPIGNGPYMLKQWNHDSSIQLVPNPKYTGPRTPKNGGVTFELYTDVQTAYADVESGNLDVIDTIPTSALATYQHENGIQAFNKPGPAFRSFTIPQKLKHFSGEEGRLRRAAISHAVNRANIIEKVMAPRPWPPISPRRRSPVIPKASKAPTCSTTTPKPPGNYGARPMQSARGAARSASPTARTAATSSAWRASRTPSRTPWASTRSHTSSPRRRS